MPPSASDPEDASVVVRDLRTEDDSGLAAIGFAAPRLSWRLAAERAAVRQVGYEIEVARSPAFAPAETIGSGLVETPRPYLADWPAPPIASREVRWWRVRVRTDLGLTAWSAAARIEATLLDRGDWIARPISPRGNVGRAERGPVPLLRRAFELDGAPVSARLYVTALGVHDTQINGHAVGPDLLEPGWTAYNDRLLFAAYDVTRLLAPCENVISAAVGDGWWRGELTWNCRRNLYGDTTALLAQLEVELEGGRRVVVATDESWRGGEGAVRMAELYHGADIDLRREPAGWRKPGFDDAGWEPVTALELPANLEPRTMPGVSEVTEFLLEVPPRLGDAPIRLDVGQNITGWLLLVVRGAAGDQVTVRHAEILSHDGRLYTEALRNARATDTYILADDEPAVLEPDFTFHGFRYAEIELPASATLEEANAIVVASGLKPTGAFECSDARLNKLFENVVWSQRGNFLALPTDCPQRDERLGWTGDLQAFASTAAANADVRTFLASWLKDLAAEQYEDGQVPPIAPNVLEGQQRRCPGVGWGDATTVAPWDLYEAYGDRQILERQFPSMRAWVDWCASRRGEDGTWTSDFQLGDWLDPAAPPDKPSRATTDRHFIATSYLAHSAGIVARTAAVLDQPELAASYAELKRAVADACWTRWRDALVATQAGCAIALMFDIAPRDERARIGQALADLVEAAGGKIATGFLGTPQVLPALTATGQTDAAYRLLLNPDCPGWLFPVLKGATTVWERWDAVGDDGFPRHDAHGAAALGMISFNHYAYGAVAAWLYRSLVGLAPCAEEPAYGKVIVAPTPGGGLTFARASILTAYGPTAAGWRFEGEDLALDVDLPPGSRALVIAPEGYAAASGDREIELASGTHKMRLRPFTAVSK
jgi:alpha-L-rhamnosidase